jgi:hypothetical protein
MDFDWTSFGTGFAKAASEKMDKEEEDAKVLAASNVKSMYENYANVVKENRTISNDVKEKINVIKGFAPDATDDQLVALAQDRGILDMLSTRLKEKDFDPTGFNINNFVKVTNTSDSKLGAEERINQLFTIPTAVNKAAVGFKSLNPESEKESPFSLSDLSLTNLFKKSGEKAANISAERTAAALGVPLEKLQGAVGYRRDIQPSGAKYSLVELKPGDTLDASIDKAAVKLAAAQKSGNPKDVEVAKANVDNLTNVKQSLSDPQQKWLNKVATLKDKQLNGNDQEKADAVKQLDALYAEEKRAAEAKQMPKEKRDNLIASYETKAADGDKEALTWLLNEAGVQAKVSEAKQTTSQQRENYLADLNLKANGQRGTPADQEAAQAKLVEMKKLDKLVAEAGQTDVQSRENKLAALRTKADGGDLAAKNELLQVAAVDKAITEAKETTAQQLTNKKADLTGKAAAGDKDAEKQLLALFAVEGQEARAKEGEATKRTNRIAELKTKLEAGDTSVKKELDSAIAIDAAAKRQEQDALQSDVSKRNDRLAALQTTITTSKDPKEVSTAKAQMVKELKLIAEEARAKHVPPSASDKVPSLGALNSFVAVSVAQAVQNKHGNLKNDMAIISKPNGDGTYYQDYDYTGDDPALKKQIQDTKVAAAKRALSVYMDNNGLPLDRNVQAVMNSWTGSSTPPAKAGGLGSRPAPEATPAPAAAPAASNTTITGSGDNTVVTVVDPTGTPRVFKGKDAVKKAEGFKAAARIK